MKKTPNAQRRTPNIEWGKTGVAETPNGAYGARPKYDLKERLLNFTASVEQLIRIFAASVRTTEKNAK